VRRLGAPADLTGDQVADLGARMGALGLGPALSGFIPSIVMDIVLQTYPPTFPSIETMSDYEDLGPAQEIIVGSARWAGWTLADDAGRPEVHVLQSGGHSAGGVVFHLPQAQFLMLADETSSVPIWSDSDPRRTEQTARRALTMLDEGAVTALCAGHRPMLPLAGDQARAALRGVLDSGASFETAVRSVLERFPEGLCIDELYDTLVDEAPPESIIEERQAVSPKGRVYRVIRTTETDAYNKPSGKAARRPYRRS
jgi:glyoxylase-like metal-dependent hydrolase (beta-lactamase superfamily II)